MRLADFGLARAYQQTRTSGLTAVGDIGGTVQFMAPQQITNFHRAGPPADLYSSAATLYNLLTAQFPHDPSEDHGSALERLLEDETVPVRSRRPGLPADLAAVIDRGLRRKADERFANATGFRAALRPFA